MIAADLLELAQPIGHDLLEPVDQSLVQLGTRPLEHPLVRDVANEDVWNR